MFSSVLIANRGVIATRIMRTLRRLGVRSVAVFHEEDKGSLHRHMADAAVCLGNGALAETYLDAEAIVQTAVQAGAQAIHPGYGFLSENAQFASLCENAGIAFIGPSPQSLSLFALKHEAREAARKAGVPLLPGSPLVTDITAALRFGAEIGYPVMLKTTAGGGGIGMQVCRGPEELERVWGTVIHLGQKYFSDGGVFLEKYIANARHIEVQVFGDGDGVVISLGERDCSAQRRNQKVIEETPAPGIRPEVRQELCATAERLMAAVSYRSAGTVEFIFDEDEQAFYFLEVNTRLQVEHGVTEQVWKIDLVEWMVKQAAGELGELRSLKKSLTPAGHAIQARIYAEDPNRDFRPSAGELSHVVWPEHDGIRIDHWIQSGTNVPALFDPLLAKVIATAESRDDALSRLIGALTSTQLYGVETNVDYLTAVLTSPPARAGKLLTRYLADLRYQSPRVEVLSGGLQTTIQDLPGRSGYWDVGVPPSGPMDELSFAIANRILDNENGAAGLEVTIRGPVLKFATSTRVAVTGAVLKVMVDGRERAMYRSFVVGAGQTLSLGTIEGAGARSYLAIAGGIQCPEYLGSRSTFTLGQFGGHCGRALQAGDVLRLQPDTSFESPDKEITVEQAPISDEFDIRVLYGPHGAPDFFTEEDIDAFFAATWEVHYNSSRTGVRLIGPKPQWARDTGGEAGMHPSNIHDNAYAFGAIDFTGDMPVILGPDGPSLGGFVCPATVIAADRWKLGQLKAGSKVRFVPVSYSTSVALEKEQNRTLVAAVTPGAGKPRVPAAGLTLPVVHEGRVGEDEVVVRLAGDHFLLVEFGPPDLDVPRRFRIHALMRHLDSHRIAGIRELTPGIRSLQIHYDSQVTTITEILDWLTGAFSVIEGRCPDSIPSRIVHLPLSWDDPACRLAIEKYTQSVRKKAPWCPSNLEFIRRINGLSDIQSVKDIVYSASYLVLGLGDVYLGAPVAIPVDPRHRLVTTKYNPARTWTAENSVGIGGSYLCVYGMEGPGGYQFVGRTLQVWNRYGQTDAFEKPWLLRFFDQIRFYEVTSEELLQIRDDLPRGKFKVRIEDSEFSLSRYLETLQQDASAIRQFQRARQDAFDAELARWRKDGQLTYEEEAPPHSAAKAAPAAGLVAVECPVSGSVWQVAIDPGTDVAVGDSLMVIESMKMEVAVSATLAGCVERIDARPGDAARAGQALMWIRPHHNETLDA